jgi:hypothetical protein
LRITSTEHQLGVLYIDGMIIYPKELRRYSGFIWLGKGATGRLL